MGLGKGGDADLEIGDALQAGNQIRRTANAAGIGLIAVGAGRRIAAERHDMADALAPVIGGQRLDLLPRRADAGEMGRRGHPCLAAHPEYGVPGRGPGRAAGAVGAGDEAGLERLQPLQGLPELLARLRRFRREELEGDDDVRMRHAGARRLEDHARLPDGAEERSSTLRTRCFGPEAGRWASQMDTVSALPRRWRTRPG